MKKQNVRDFLYLVEVLETFISEGDGDGEDGVGAVLVKASLTISSKQSQSPASADVKWWNMWMLIQRKYETSCLDCAQCSFGSLEAGKPALKPPEWVNNRSFCCACPASHSSFHSFKNEKQTRRDFFDWVICHSKHHVCFYLYEGMFLCCDDAGKAAERLGKVGAALPNEQKWRRLWWVTASEF